MKRGVCLAAVFLCLFIMKDYAVALCVNVSDANLRSGPGTKYKKTWEVFKYMPFRELERKGSWHKVKDVDGDVHWIYTKLVTDKFQCAVVKADKANVRTGPGTEYAMSPLSPALKYDSYKVIDRKSLWVQVMDEFGDTGWIYRNLVWIN